MNCFYTAYTTHLSQEQSIRFRISFLPSMPTDIDIGLTITSEDTEKGTLLRYRK